MPDRKFMDRYIYISSIKFGRGLRVWLTYSNLFCILGASLGVLGRSLGVLGFTLDVLGHNLGVLGHSLRVLGFNLHVLERSLGTSKVPGPVQGARGSPGCQGQFRMPEPVQNGRASQECQGRSGVQGPVGQHCTLMCCAQLIPACYTRGATRSLVQLDVLCICCWIATGVR